MTSSPADNLSCPREVICTVGSRQQAAVPFTAAAAESTINLSSSNSNRHSILLTFSHSQPQPLLQQQYLITVSKQEQQQQIQFEVQFAVLETTLQQRQQQQQQQQQLLRELLFSKVEEFRQTVVAIIGQHRPTTTDTRPPIEVQVLVVVAFSEVDTCREKPPELEFLKTCTTAAIEIAQPGSRVSRFRRLPAVGHIRSPSTTTTTTNNRATIDIPSNSISHNSNFPKVIFS